MSREPNAMRIDRCRIGTTLLLAMVVAVASGCSSDRNNPAEPDPDPELPIVTEVFEGQISHQTISCHDFELSVDGNVEMQITDLQPLGSLTVGLGLGTPDPEAPGECARFVNDGSVNLGDVLASSGLEAGPYCACVFDVGNIFVGQDVDYALEVSHP